MYRDLHAGRRIVPAIVLLLILMVAGAHAASGTGTLTASSTPEGASLSFDGTLLGTTPFTGTVASGDHRIILALDG